MKAIEMWWLDDIVVPAVLILGVYCFVAHVRSSTKRSIRRSSRTAESMYPNYADSIKKQRKYARQHGGTWRSDDGQQDPLAKRVAPPRRTN